MATLTFVKTKKSIGSSLEISEIWMVCDKDLFNKNTLPKTNKKNICPNMENVFTLSCKRAPAGYVGVIDGDIELQPIPNIKERALAHICSRNA